MSPEGWQALTAAFVALNTLFLLMAAIYARAAKEANERTEAAALRTEHVATQTMKNTNHLTEVLVATTAVAAHATGKEEGRVEGENKAAVLAAQTDDNKPTPAAA